MVSGITNSFILKSARVEFNPLLGDYGTRPLHKTTPGTKENKGMTIPNLAF